MAVVALGQVSVYAARGDLQLVIRQIEARGDGLWRKALERRSQQRLPWGKMRKLLERFPLPAPRIVHKYAI